MPVYRTQFHAARDELITIAAEWVRYHVLTVALERFYPEYEPVAMPETMLLPDAVRALEPVRRICLARQPFMVDGIVTQEDFLDFNRDCLVISLEPVSDDGLREIALGTLTNDEATLEHWLALVRELDAVMHQGATVVDPRGGRRVDANHRHTAGAHALAARGVRMLAAAGDTYFEFDDVVPRRTRRTG